MGILSCVEGWPGRKDKDGYPIVRIGNKYRTVARLMHELFVGPVSPGQCVRHSCDNRACVNPAHLEVGTQADNMADKVHRNRQPRGEAWHAARYSDEIIGKIRANPDIYNVSYAQSLWAMSKSQYYRIRNGESRQQGPGGRTRDE